jgi:diaminopimelate epimerase
MSAMRFTKMHGAGNDYLYVNGFVERVENPSELSRAMADRHFGVGSDGLILILPSDKADVRMRIFNADGSEGEMCGNGIRCVAKFAYERGISRNNPMRVETGRGVLTLQMQIESDRVQQVSVNMGRPVFDAAKVPVDLPVARVIDEPLPPLQTSGLSEDWYDQCGLDPRITCVNTGNPHVVLYCADISKVPLERVGPVLENHPIFPCRANVHFVTVNSRGEVRMRTWERGSGITLACGTGASAVCAAGVVTDRTDRKILAHLPGGDLSIDWRESDDCIYMTGPATEVFSGDWDETLQRRVPRV